MKLVTLILWLVALALAVVLALAARKHKNDPQAFKPYRFGIGIPLVLIFAFLAYVNLFGWPV